MIIAVNTRILSGNYASAHLLHTCFKKIAIENSGHSFVFISEKKDGHTTTDLQNTSFQIVEQKSASPLLWKLWYNYKLPALLRKIKADVLINADGVCSLLTKVPQYVLVNELVSQQQSWYPKKYKRFMLANQRAFFQKAAHVFAASDVLRQQIIQQYKIENTKTSMLYPFTDERYQPVEWIEKEQVKEQYTQGKDYFLCIGPLQQRSNLINLLKAFSFFKRRQKSNMQLVIAVEHLGHDDGFIASLETYKYRKEVVLIENIAVQELCKITAASYAFVSPSWQENNFSNALNALQCSVPVILGDNETNRELFADAALYADPSSFEDIADKMMLLFKDETRRNQYIEKGLLRSQEFDWQKTAAELWKPIVTPIQ